MIAHLDSNHSTSLLRFTCLPWLQCVPGLVRSDPSLALDLKFSDRVADVQLESSIILNKQIAFILFRFERNLISTNTDILVILFYTLSNVVQQVYRGFTNCSLCRFSKKIRQFVCQTTVRSCSSHSQQQIQEVYFPVNHKINSIYTVTRKLKGLVCFRPR